jgi:hypothetical protein
MSLPTGRLLRAARSQIGCDTAEKTAVLDHYYTRKMAYAVGGCGDPLLRLWYFLKTGLAPHEFSLTMYSQICEEVATRFDLFKLSAALVACPKTNKSKVLTVGMMLSNEYKVAYMHIPDVLTPDGGAAHSTVGVPAYLWESSRAHFENGPNVAFFDLIMKAFCSCEVSLAYRSSEPYNVQFVKQILLLGKRCMADGCCLNGGFHQQTTKDVCVLRDWLIRTSRVVKEDCGVPKCRHTQNWGVGFAEYGRVTTTIKSILNQPSVQVQFGTLSGQWVGEGRAELKRYSDAPSTRCLGYLDTGPACNEMGMYLR